MLAWALILCATAAFAGQGAQRMLYAVPNSTFIQNPAGDSVVTVADTSGSITTLQALLDNARSANPNSIIVVRLLSGATYWVSNAGLVLGSQECLVATGALIKATNSAVTVPLIQINSASTNVSVAGGTLDGTGANICGILGQAANRVNLDRVTVLNCGQDCIQLNGNGDTTFDNELTVTRCEASGSPGHAGISFWNTTQAVCVDNYSHNNSVGIWLGNCAYASVANNSCRSNSVGIDFDSGNDNYIANNTCNNNGTGILAAGSSSLVVSDALGGNATAGINSTGSGNIYVDNLFTAGNAATFLSNGSGDKVVAYQGTLNASGQDYFYPPLINDQHSNPIVNGLGRVDLTIGSTTLDDVQSQYNTAVAANPNSVVVLHLNGTFTVGANPLALSANTCVLLNGTIQLSSSTTASAAITGVNSPTHVCISGGVIDGGNQTGHHGIQFSGASMLQVDGVTLQNFGSSSSRQGGSDVIAFDHGATPRIITRCTVSGGAARGIWLETGGVKNIVSDCESSGVNEDGVDCDASTSGSLVKFNYCHNNVRYGVFVEQSASYNLLLGNVCNYNSSYDIGLYNNSTTARPDTAFNSMVCNSLLGNNGLRNGSTGSTSVQTSHNFFFNNTVVSANIQSQLYGTQNYYSQNYLSGSSLSTSGTELFFNSPEVSGNLQVQDSHSGLDTLVQNAATTNGAAVVTGAATGLGNDLWQLIPTDSGYYRLMNEKSGLALVVLNASLSSGASIIQWTYNGSQNDEWMPVSAGNGLYYFLNRLSGLYLDVTGAGTTPGTQLDQQPFTGDANQQFRLLDTPPPAAPATGLSTASWTGGAAPDGNWQTPANWGGAAPQPGDWLAFGSGSQFLTTNNFPSGMVFDSVAFTSGSGSFTLAGNGLALAEAAQGPSGNMLGGAITEGSVNSQTIALPVTLASGTHVITTAGGAGALTLSGALTRNTGATVQFSKSGGAINSGLANNAAGVMGGWGIYSSSTALINNSGGAGTVDWATASGGAVAAYSGYTTVSGSGQTFADNSTSNLKVTGNGSSDDKVGSGTTTINSLNWVAPNQNGYIDIPTGSTLRFGAQGGVLMNVNKYLRIGNGQAGSAVTAGGADSSAGELCLYNLSYYAADAVEFWTTLTDNGSSAYPLTLTTFGSVRIDNPNTYSGGTYINWGEFWCNGGGNTPFGTGPVYVFPGGRADLGGDNDATVANNFYLAGQGFVAANAPAALKGTYNGMLNGLITLMGDAQVDPNAGAWPNTCTFNGGFTGTGSLTIGGASGVVAGVATFAGTCTYSGDTVIDATANANGGTGIFITSGRNNLLQNGGGLILLGGSSGKATFDLNGTTQTINGLFATNAYANNALVQSSAGPGLLVAGGNDVSSTFSGKLQNGSGTLALTKLGAGTLILAGANTYTGPTTVSNGVLAVSGSISNSALITLAPGTTLDASGRPGQTFVLGSGQTLQGIGTIAVNLAVSPGAQVMPGSGTGLGTLNIPSSAQLQGLTVMKLRALDGSSDQMTASSFSYGGALTVTNLSGTLNAGQSFQLFVADAYSGSSSSVNLPELGAGLVWSNTLAIDGTLTVVSAAPSYLGLLGLSLSGSNLTLTGTNAGAGTFYVLASTNVMGPRFQWQPVATNVATGSGSFALTLTNSVSPQAPQQFFQLSTTPNWPYAVRSRNPKLESKDGKRMGVRKLKPIRLQFGLRIWDLVSAIVLALALSGVEAAPATISPGAPWLDQKGLPVQGHGGNIIQVGSTFYWFGENKTGENAADASFQSVRCYASTDLEHWTCRGDALTRRPDGDLGPNRIVERPKVLYNAATHRFVMYMHIDRPGYGTGKVGIATSRNVEGPYSYKGSLKPLGLRSWDLNLFQDDDGTAYLLTHASDNRLHIERLSADYRSVTESVAALRPNYEAPALLKANGRYYLFGSELTGWNSNDNKYTTATNLTGPWTKWRLFAPAGSLTFNSQVAWVLPLRGSHGTTFVYMGDRWNPADLGASTYVWLPLEVKGTNLWLLDYPRWTLDAATGLWHADGPPPPRPLPERPSLAAGKSVSADGEQTDNAATYGNDDDPTTRWCAPDGKPGHWWTVDLGRLCPVGRTEVYWETKGAYQYRIQVSDDNLQWSTVVDQSSNTNASAVMKDAFTASTRYVRITVTGLPPGLWASFYEFKVFPGTPFPRHLEGGQRD